VLMREYHQLFLLAGSSIVLAELDGHRHNLPFHAPCKPQRAVSCPVDRNNEHVVMLSF
jgi:hypothetical protein